MAETLPREDVLMLVQCETDSRILQLEDDPLGRGGEAAIYPVAGDSTLAAKIYHHPTPQHATKLRAMQANPPADPMAGLGHVSIAWPLARLWSVGGDPQCLGFLMPRVEKALPIVEYFNPRARLQQCPLFHFGYLLRTARNLAAAVCAIHERGYVIGDLNESNVLVTSQALTTLVDTDSFQVRDELGVFRCSVAKAEYTPPELQGANLAEVDRGPEHDAFALGVLIFQLLLQGFHPFAGKYSGDGDPVPMAERIRCNYWPYAKKDRGPFEVNPLAPTLAVLPATLQELLYLCFRRGHQEPLKRPSPRRWQRALSEAEKELKPCSVNEQHVYHQGMRKCPWCSLARKQGRDLFPSRASVLAGNIGLKASAGTIPWVIAADPARPPAPIPWALPGDPSPPPPPASPWWASSTLWLALLLAVVFVLFLIFLFRLNNDPSSRPTRGSAGGASLDYRPEALIAILEIKF